MTDEKRPRGRPRADNPKSVAVKVRLTPDEHDLIASAAGENISGWIREKAIAAAKRAR